jgi:GT2 family glycosyltransferase
MADQLDLSIIIINWNSVAFLRKCLATVRDNAAGLRYEVIVVDNSSYDGSAEMMRNEFPDYRFIQSQENQGFSRANNLGFRHSSGRHVLFLNPDTEIAGAALQKMVQVLDSAPDAGIAGAHLLNSDGSVQTSCIQRFPGILNQCLDADFLRDRFPNLAIWGMQPLLRKSKKPSPVEVISGACLMIQRDVFEAVGQFDEGYFMYAEDTDLSYKVYSASRKNYYCPTAVVTHHGGQSSSSAPQSNFSTVMIRESLHRFFVVHKGGLYAALYRVLTGVAALGRLLLLSLLLVLSLGCFRRGALLNAFRKWARVLRWSLGLEGWVNKLVRPKTMSEVAVTSAK